jgi:hypothetical protein
MPSGWIEAKEEIEVKPCIVLSVGFLVKETEDHLIIATDTSNGGHNSRSQIPKGMIKKIKVIRKGDKKDGPSKAATTTDSRGDGLSPPTGQLLDRRQDESNGNELRPERPIKRSTSGTENSEG